jgi:coniferyl-aldehyde dehydrogenase
MTEEVFGPILPIINFKHISEAIDYVNARPKPLACYYFGSRFGKNLKRVENEISAGGMVFNDVLMHVVNPDLPFGGVGESGYGKYHGITGHRAMSNPKAILYKGPSNFYPYNTFDWPFTSHRQGLIKCLLKYA